MKCTVSYAKVNNAGDLLNEYIINKIFGLEVVYENRYKASLSAIGSGLSKYEKARDIKERLKQLIYPKKTIYIWGTGFLTYPVEQNISFYSDKLFSCAVRGELTKKRVEDIIKKKLDIPTCDGGILTSELFKSPPQKKYTMGIIPHYKEQGEKIFKELGQYYDNSIVINLRDDPMTVFEQIASCENVVSSSLHGLIIADSFRIPNLHIKVTNNMLGDGYKYADYYSCYGLPDNYYTPSSVNMPTIEYIRESYVITDKMVETKKEQMIKAFPKQLLLSK